MLKRFAIPLCHCNVTRHTCDTALQKKKDKTNVAYDAKTPLSIIIPTAVYIPWLMSFKSESLKIDKRAGVF